MKPQAQALFYPFHLCHQETLGRLLLRFQTVHFRDFMALQLTPFSGMTALQNRMGDDVPELLLSGRLVQGYTVCGPLPPDVAEGTNRDLSDTLWRSLFHRALLDDVRFRRGLFQEGELPFVPDDRLQSSEYSVGYVRRLSAERDDSTHAVNFDYGLALVKTSASLVYTYRLALAHGLQAATDSAVHYSLFTRSCQREQLDIANHLLLRKGY
jgi:hypothetical protein